MKSVESRYYHISTKNFKIGERCQYRDHSVKERRLVFVAGA